MDPLGKKYYGWSGYNYVMDSPVIFIDPKGRSVEDIILKGSKEEQRALLGKLQALTNDKLIIHPETGEVLILKSGSENTSKDLPEGTSLIRDLIEDDNTTFIRASVKGVGTSIADEKGNKVKDQSIQLGEEKNSVISFQLNRHVNTVNNDGTRGAVPNFISLAHELGHARSNAKGTNDRRIFQAFDFDTNSIRPVTVEEFNARVNENKIRAEQGLKLRALPIPIVLFTVRF